jgi:hypothetical protein
MPVLSKKDAPMRTGHHPKGVTGKKEENE